MPTIAMTEPTPTLLCSCFAAWVMMSPGRWPLAGGRAPGHQHLHHQRSCESFATSRSTPLRPATVTALMAYVPTAVAVGHLRQPETELPMPGPDFARRISTLLASAANCSDVYAGLPARPGPRARTLPDPHRGSPPASPRRR
jgi:hypothetical protein